MAVAAILIAVYHLWIPVLPAAGLPGQVERFLVAIGYIGVDLFFFLSAYTLTFSDLTSRQSFILGGSERCIPCSSCFAQPPLSWGS